MFQFHYTDAAQATLPNRTFRYSLLTISTTVISRGTVLVDGGKEAGGFLGVASVGGVDLSTETGNVSNTTRWLLSEASCTS